MTEGFSQGGEMLSRINFEMAAMRLSETRSDAVGRLLAQKIATAAYMHAMTEVAHHMVMNGQRYNLSGHPDAVLYDPEEVILELQMDPDEEPRVFENARVVKTEDTPKGPNLIIEADNVEDFWRLPLRNVVDLRLAPLPSDQEAADPNR